MSTWAKEVYRKRSEMIKEHFVLKSGINLCPFCDEVLNHIKKTKDGQLLSCKCEATFIKKDKK
jgi:hypothetical protein